MKYLQQIAIVLIALVISITINTSIAFASLNVNYINGQDNINNYRRENDYTKIEINASIDGDTDITTSQVKIGSCNSATAFQSCSSGVCVFQSSVATITPKTYTGTIVLCNDANQQVDSKSYSLTVDNTAPTASFNYASGTVSFSAADTACSACAGCSGIQKIDVVVDGVIQKTVSGNSLCSYQNTTDLTLNVQGTETKHVCLDVYDNVQNKGTICKDIFIDNSAPSIVDATLIANGVPVTTINGAPIMNAQLLVRINEDVGLKDGSVRADLSGLNENSAFKQQYSNIQGTCTKSTYYNCVFPFILQLSNGGSIPIRVEAIDNNSNVMNATYNINLNVDTTAPQSTSIKTNYRDSVGNYWIGPANNTIYVDILETGSGFNNKIVTLDMSSILTDTGRYLPTTCTSGWTCMWMIPNSKMKTLVTGNSYPITITYPSQDDAGNQLTGVTSLSVKYDESKPIVNSVKMFSADQHGNRFDCFADECKKGDYAEIHLNISDTGSNQIIVTADLSDITGQSDAELSCNYDGTNHLCSISTDPLNGPFENTKINFKIKDLTGNTLEYPSEEFNIAGLTNQTDLWTIGTITQRPEVIDRQTTVLINHRIYYSIPLTGSNAHILRAYITSCNSDLIETYSIMNNVGTTNPFVELVLAKGEFPDNNYNVTCKLEIISLLGNTAYGPEKKNLTLPLNFYNLPVGYLPNEVKNEIERVKSSELVNGSLIKTLEVTTKVMKGFCWIYEFILTIDSIFAIFGGSVGPIIQKIPIIGVPIEAAIRGGSAGLTGISKVIGLAFEWMCAAASCRLTEKILTVLTDSPKFSKVIMNSLYSNPEKSIYSSLATLCIPGIYYNLEKARQVECNYALCLRDQVPAGLPVSICTYQRSFEWCKFVFGQNWNAVPFIQIWNYAMEALSEAVKNPIALTFAVAGLLCLLIPAADGAWYCKIPNGISAVNQVYLYVKGLTEKQGQLKGDVCEALLNETAAI